MKKITIAFLFLGILFEFFAFTLGYPEKFTFVTPLLCPSYTRADKGVRHLASNFNLTDKDDGFEIISNIFMSLLKQQNSSAK